MKNIIVSIISIFILISGICLIVFILREHNQLDNNITTNETELILQDYSVSYTGNNYEMISVNESMLGSFKIDYNGIEIAYNGTLRINNNVIIKNITYTNYLAVYNKNLIVIPYKIGDVGGLVIYNIDKTTYEIIDQIDNKYITYKDITYTDAGFNLELTLIKDDKVLFEKEYDICKTNREDPVYFNIIYIYDENKKKFDGYETISSLGLEDYKDNNNLCQ